MKKIMIMMSVFLFGCSSTVEKGSNGMTHHAFDLESFNNWKWEQERSEINTIEHLLFKAKQLENELEISKIKGGLNCIPAQIKISERYLKRFYGEYYNKLITDSETTLVKIEEQNNKINLMLEEIRFETACMPNNDYYLTEINKRIKQIENGGIYFELDSDELSKESIRKTKQIAYLLKDFEINSAVVLGHTSEEHTLDYNYELGKKRSLRVKGVLLDEGFETDKIITRSYSKLLRTSENKNHNRKVTIRVFEENLEEQDRIHKIKVNYRIKDWDIERY